MDFVVCLVAVAPLRKEPSHRSEMISELLFGEFAVVLEEEKDFIRIKCLYDDYEGWCQRSQLAYTEESVVDDAVYFFVNDLTDDVMLNGVNMKVPFATPVHPGARVNRALHFGKYEVRYMLKERAWNAADVPFIEETIQLITNRFLNVPYLWGGKSVYGIDCSGFTQQAYKMLGIRLPRDAYQQAEIGEPVGFLQETKCGDLAFFDNEEGKITHVGILLSSDTIIHSSGRVRIDKIDHAGIINVETGERTHSLRLIKRYK